MSTGSRDRRNRGGTSAARLIVALGCVLLVATACSAQGNPPSASGSDTASSSQSIDVSGASSAGSISPLTSGGSIDPLTSVAEYKAGVNATLSVAADAPPGSSGDSFQASIAGLAAGTPSFNRRAVTLDLSAYGDAATFRLWVKSSSLENLGAIYLEFWSAKGWVAYRTQPATAGAWQEFALAKGPPPGSGGSIDWSAISKIYLRADASANRPYTGDVLWRDLRITQ